MGDFRNHRRHDPDTRFLHDEFNIGIQRELGFQTALELRYVHGRSTQLWRTLTSNQLDITGNGFLGDFSARSRTSRSSRRAGRRFRTTQPDGAQRTAQLALFP